MMLTPRIGGLVSIAGPFRQFRELTVLIFQTTRKFMMALLWVFRLLQGNSRRKKSGRLAKLFTKSCGQQAQSEDSLKDADRSVAESTGVI
jgi:hypothetical protein